MTVAPSLFPVPKGWKLLNVEKIRSPEKSSCVSGPFGSKIASKYFVDEGVPVIRGNNLRDDLTRFVPSGFVFVSESQAGEYRPQHVKGGDLVFTCWGTIGQVGLIPDNGPFEQYIISNKQLKLRVDRRIANPVFCFYQIASPAGVGYIRNRGIGGAVPGINLGILKALPVALPDLEIQDRIVSVLSAYDDLIENNRRRVVLLEESARLLYREWFVCLRFPGHEHTRVTKGVPEGWQRKILGDVMTLKRGYDLPANDRVDGPIPIVSSSGITGYHAEKKCDPPGIVTGRYGTLGEVYFIQQPFWPLNTALYVSDFKDTPAAFAALILKQALEGTQSDKAAIPGLNRNVVHCLPVLWPPKALRDEFNESALLCYQQTRVLELQNEKLRTARDLLLPKLMSGEIII